MWRLAPRCTHLTLGTLGSRKKQQKTFCKVYFPKCNSAWPPPLFPFQLNLYFFLLFDNTSKLFEKKSTKFSSPCWFPLCFSPLICNFLSCRSPTSTACLWMSFQSWRTQTTTVGTQEESATSRGVTPQIPTYAGSTVLCGSVGRQAPHQVLPFLLYLVLWFPFHCSLPLKPINSLTKENDLCNTTLHYELPDMNERWICIHFSQGISPCFDLGNNPLPVAWMTKTY